MPYGGTVENVRRLFNDGGARARDGDPPANGATHDAHADDCHVEVPRQSLSRPFHWNSCSPLNERNLPEMTKQSIYVG